MRSEARAVSGVAHRPINNLRRQDQVKRPGLARPVEKLQITATVAPDGCSPLFQEMEEPIKRPCAVRTSCLRKRQTTGALCGNIRHSSNSLKGTGLLSRRPARANRKSDTDSAEPADSLTLL